MLFNKRCGISIFMDDFTKVSREIYQAQEQAKRTSGLNLHRFNNFIIDKGLERNKLLREKKGRQSDAVIENRCHEGAQDIHRTVVDKRVHCFGT